MVSKTANERFDAKFLIDAATGCWVWVARIDRYGYGRFASGSKVNSAHRFSYERHAGSIPKGLQIDHTCRNRACVNPAHLEAVTSRENTIRGVGPSAIHARKTHCIHGHPLSGENLYVEPKGGRRCRECGRAKEKRRALRGRIRSLATRLGGKS